MKLGLVTSGALWEDVIGDVRFSSLDAAAQIFADRFYDYYIESTVLARVFVTLPFARLPQAQRRVAREFAARFPDAPALTEATDVLTLLGTRGTQPAWNSPADSRGHRAIPLLSSAFVGEIPMIARVLAETGFMPFLAPGATRSQYVTRWKDQPDGSFFIGDARVTTDERGRLIIPATQFVAQYGVRTVFGFGGPYPAGLDQRIFFTAIVFSRETLLRATAAAYVQLAGDFKERTNELLRTGALFA